MTSINSPQRQRRRDIRYPLHLPVLVNLADKEILTRSENVSLGGILLSSAVTIPEDSAVGVDVGVAHPSQLGTLLTARGKVVRVQTRPSGDLAVAVQLERPFKIPLQKLNKRSSSKGKGSPFLEGRLSSPWRNCLCFVTCDKACGNAKMIRGAD
ncbi:MAG: PilZ domain-containing protein [Acidobacteriia bacterium]|nr:PilZ domain-containing protein [Terriglobia bacterium]